MYFQEKENKKQVKFNLIFFKSILPIWLAEMIKDL